MSSKIASLLCVLALSTTQMVLASPGGSMPSACEESTQTQRAYKTGLLAGRSLVQRAWQSVNECNQLDYFSNVVRANIEGYTVQGATTYSICRYAGMVDGAYEELDVVWTACGGSCCWEGEVIGMLAADVYCRLSELLGGLLIPDDFVPRPVCLCAGFSGCCGAAFNDVTRERCEQYTLPPFRDVWLTSRALQCNG